MKKFDLKRIKKRTDVIETIKKSISLKRIKGKIKPDKWSMNVPRQRPHRNCNLNEGIKERRKKQTARTTNCQINNRVMCTTVN